MNFHFLLDSHHHHGHQHHQPSVSCPLSGKKKDQQVSFSPPLTESLELLEWSLYQAPKGIQRPRACSRGWNVGWQGSEFGIGPFDISCLFRGQKTNFHHRPVQWDLTERKIFLLLLSLKYWYPYILYPYMHILHISCVHISHIHRPM